MAADRESRGVVRVALGAVVENVSTINDANGCDSTQPPWLGSDASLLRVLITRRGAERVLAGCWELPGGKIEDDESTEQAVMRELREEVGIEVQPMMPLDVVEHDYDHASVQLLTLVCRRVSGLPRAIEVDDVRWVKLDALGAYTFPDATLPIIDALRDMIDTDTDTTTTRASTAEPPSRAIPRGSINRKPD